MISILFSGCTHCHFTWLLYVLSLYEGWVYTDYHKPIEVYTNVLTLFDTNPCIILVFTNNLYKIIIVHG